MLVGRLCQIDQAAFEAPTDQSVPLPLALQTPLPAGLPMEALEKTRCNGSDAAQRPFSLVRFVEEIPRKVGLFPIFQEQRRRISLQLRLRSEEHTSELQSL